MRRCAVNPGFVRFFLVFCLTFGGIFVTGCGGKAETSAPPAARDAEKKGGAEEKSGAKTQGQEALAGKAVGRQAALPVAGGLYSPQELDAAFQDFLKEFADDTNLETLEPPAKVVYYFIRALQLKDEKVIYALLTEAAREERYKMQIPLGPDGCENATVNLGNVQYVEDPDTGEVVGARVGTVWMLPDPEKKGEDVEEPIAWVLGKENGEKWGIAGMVAIIDLRLSPVLVNFENIQETAEQLQKLEEEIQSLLKGESTAVESGSPAAEASTSAAESATDGEALPGLMLPADF